MRPARLTPLAVAALALAAGGCGGDDESPAPDAFDADRAFADLEAQVEFGPRPSGSPGAEKTTAYIANELEDAGVEDVQVQRPYANVVGRIPGSETGAVVVGAHWDTKDDIPGFVGANDGASGVAVVLELARALAPQAPLDGPSIHLALFDAEEARRARPFEEDGTRGSRQYRDYARRDDEVINGPPDSADRQGAPPFDEIEAMVLFDMVGDCDLQIPLEANSDPELYALFADAAEEATGEAAPFEGETTPIGDDHVPFLEFSIPAVDFIDFTYGSDTSPGQYWHTSADTLDKVCAESLDAVGEAAVIAVPRIR